MLALSLGCLTGSLRAEVKFPFAAEIDKAAGETGELPNRVQHRATGLWFVLVPGGEYDIGDDEREDSAKIKVKLSSYYIAEREVTHGVIAKYHLERFKAIESEVEASEPKPTDDELLAIRVFALMFYTMEWPFDMDLDSDIQIQMGTIAARMTEWSRRQRTNGETNHLSSPTTTAK
jgi:hypothetical protein